MLLRIEVTAFHPATLRTVTDTRRTEVAVPVCVNAPALQTRLCGPIPRCEHARAGRLLAAIPPYGVRTFLDENKFATIAQFVLPGHCNGRFCA